MQRIKPGVIQGFKILFLLGTKVVFVCLAVMFDRILVNVSAATFTSSMKRICEKSVFEISFWILPISITVLERVSLRILFLSLRLRSVGLWSVMCDSITSVVEGNFVFSRTWS